MTRPDLMEEAPVAWRWRQRNGDKWGAWNLCWDSHSLSETSDYWRNLAATIDEVECKPLYSASALAAAEARGREEALRDIETALTDAPVGVHTVNGIEMARLIVWELRAAIRRGTP